MLEEEEAPSRLRVVRKDRLPRYKRERLDPKRLKYFEDDEEEDEDDDE